MTVIKRTTALFAFCLLLSGLFTAPRAAATDQYARETGKGCIFCHQESSGGPLRTAGFGYIRNGYRYPVSQRGHRSKKELIHF